MTPGRFNQQNEDEHYKYYRGLRLTFIPRQKIIFWQSPKKDGFKVKVIADNESKRILELLSSIRPEGGSFRITELNEVLIKVQGSEEDPPEIPKYVTTLKAPLNYEKILNTPKDLSPGDLWEGIYDGTRFSFVPTANGEQNIWWSTVEDFSVRYKLLATMPQTLHRSLISFKPLGGRFCITPHGYILTLVDKGLLSNNARNRYAELYEAEKWDPLRLIDSKETRTGLFPIFIGIWNINNDDWLFLPPRRWGQEISQSERNRMLQTISGLLSNESSGMVIATDQGKEDNIDDEIDKDASVASEDMDIALIPTEDDWIVKNEILEMQEEE